MLGACFTLSVGACTTILVTKGASADGSVFVSHSDDDELGDQRLVYVPAMDHPAGSTRPVYYFGYLFVNQGRSWLPDPIGGICRYGPDKPDTTCFVPFYAGVTELPMAYQHGRTDTFDRKSAWWAFNFVANWAELNYGLISKEIIAKQKELEGKEMAILEAVETAALQLYEKDQGLAREYITNFSIGNAERIVGEWWDFGEKLIAKYDDGFLEEPGEEPVETGYPEGWLKEVGYADGPITYEKPAK